MNSKGIKLLDELEEFSAPLFPKLTASSFNRICGEWCLVFVGEKKNLNPEFINAAQNMPFNTARIKPSSKLGLSFHSVHKTLKEKQKLEESEKVSEHEIEWIVIMKERFWSVEIEKVNDFVTLCSDLYRSDDKESILKNFTQFEMPKHEKGIKEIFDIVLEFIYEEIPFLLENEQLLIVLGIISFILVVVVVKKLLFGKKKETQVVQKISSKENGKVEDEKHEDEKHEDEKHENDNVETENDKQKLENKDVENHENSITEKAKNSEIEEITEKNDNIE
ncbi:hypothetical protein TRFO_31984 [Tritrichomonas foetus]|uniref:Uncharacterized protein n=1 Tax=Tritrichomonas foetus TaxID=1144522 RepID=A0A1J4JQ49_9EUKA|nr:hypothetical protein TRFO_31984 [Tritrichomonas foetus]|eukprot:OHT01241.1 hypothetical protein TRFO_31984 [Tritrichomonas foetus]